MFQTLIEAIVGSLEEGRRSALKKIDRYSGSRDMPHGMRVAPVGSYRVPKTGAGKVVRVPLHSLSATQPDVDPEDVKRHVVDPQLAVRNPRKARRGEGDTSMPVVLKKGGKLYVADGHHRLAARKLQGKKHARVRLHDFD